MGTTVYYVWPKKKKKRKTRAEKRRAEEDTSDNEPFELKSILEDRDENMDMLPIDQGDGPTGKTPDNVLME